MQKKKIEQVFRDPIHGYINISYEIITEIIDSSVLVQLIEDNSLSIFPQMVLTERPDRICSWLLIGKLVVLVDGSPLAIACPQSFLEYFQIR